MKTTTKTHILALSFTLLYVSIIAFFVFGIFNVREMFRYLENHYSFVILFVFYCLLVFLSAFLFYYNLYAFYIHKHSKEAKELKTSKKLLKESLGRTKSKSNKPRKETKEM